MLTSHTLSHNPFLLPTGDLQNPVCVGDMPSYRYQVSANTMTEDVTSYLEQHPEIPGVILIDNGHFHGIIPRSRMFERLGHMYGVELFLRKPIIELQKNLGTQSYTLSSDLRIQDAVNTALKRPAESIFEPLVILFEHEIRLLDMYTLLIAQSQSLHNMNNLMGSLTHLEQTIEAGSPIEKTLDLALASLRKVVPFHKVTIHIKGHHSQYLVGRHVAFHALDDRLNNNKIFQIVLNIHQPLHVEDVSLVPAWEKLDVFDKAHSWMGAPLLNSDETLGILSLVRHSKSPFNRDEMNMTIAFANLMSKALRKSITAIVG